MLHLHAKAPGDELVTQPVDLEVSYDEVFGRREEAYQRLLEDAMDGDARRFGREDSLDEQWRIVEQVLEHHDEIHLYAEGSWGPQGRRGAGCALRRLGRAAPRRQALTLRVCPGADSSRTSSGAWFGDQAHDGGGHLVGGLGRADLVGVAAGWP